MTTTEIDAGVAILLELVKVGGSFYPPLHMVEPLIAAFIRYQAHVIKSGLADGSIVPDGQGGFVPASNSKYDPVTGRFL